MILANLLEHCHVVKNHQTKHLGYANHTRHLPMAASSSSGEPPGLPAALAFFRVFPEATSYHVLILNANKHAVVSLPQASAESACLNVRMWLQMEKAHVFVRPNVANLVMVDADNYQGDMATLFALKPRCLAETSPGNYQLWLVLGKHLAGKAALQVTKDLSRALGADMASAKTTQVGRLPGSVNVKPGKGNQVTLLHSCLQDMDEAVYMRLAPKTTFSFGDSGPHVRTAPPRQPAGGLDCSKLDWAMACSFFEEHPEAQLEEARGMLAGRFQAQRANQGYYEDLTLSNAFAHVRALSRRGQTVCHLPQADQFEAYKPQKVLSRS